MVLFLEKIHMSYAISGAGIIYELLDNEVIIANLDVGVYYSLRGSGPLIWQLLLAGYTQISLQSLFSEKYGPIPSLSPFIDRLLEENLLVLAEGSSAPLPSVFWPAEFVPPTLERFDEMKNLLMLDPIHEVDEQGWPHRK